MTFLNPSVENVYKGCIGLIVFHRADTALLGFMVYHVRLDLVFFIFLALVILEFYSKIALNGSTNLGYQEHRSARLPQAGSGFY